MSSADLPAQAVQFIESVLALMPALAVFRALYRAVQIYLGYILVAFFTFATLFALRNVAEPYFAPTGEFALLFADPARALVAAAGLYYTPGYLDILPLYLWLVAAAPPMVWALRRAPRATLLASASLWLAAQAGVLPQLPSLDPGGAATLDPLYWQLLFCLGLGAGQYFHRAGNHFHAIPPLQGLCGAMVVAGLLCSVMDHAARVHLAQHVPLVAAAHDLREAVRTGAGEHPLRLLHFLAVAYLVAGVMGATHPLLRSAWARPLVLTGQFSLQSYCLGAVLSLLGTLYWRAYAPSLVAQTLATLLGCALTALLALAVNAQRGSRAARAGRATQRLVPGVDKPSAVEA